MIDDVLKIVAIGLSMLDKYIDDPKRRLEARQSYIDALREQARAILDEKDYEKMDKLLLSFVGAVHAL
jgi:hypothetical protein